MALSRPRPADSPSWLRECWFLGLVLVVATVLRVGAGLERSGQLDFDRPIVDAEWHHWWAVGWATGEWETPRGQPDPQLGRQSYLRPPGYPAFVSLIYRLLGVSVAAVVVVQAVLGLLRTVLVWVLTRRVAGRGAANLAAALVGTWWTLIHFEGELQSPALLDVLVLGVWCCAAGGPAPSPLRMGASGLLAGLALLVRPDAAPLVLVPVVLGALRRPRASRRLRGLAIGLATLLLPLFPVAVRNHEVSGRWVPVSANLAVNLYLGNHAGADGTCGDRIPGVGRFATCWDWASVRRTLGRDGEVASEAEVAAWFRRAALDDVLDDPVRWLGLELRKLRMFLGPREIGHNKELAVDREHSVWLRWLPGPFPLLVVLAGFAALKAWPRRTEDGARSLLAMALAVLGMGAVLMLFFVSARHRLPTVPLLASMAGVGGAELVRRLRQDSRSLGAPLLGMMVALVALCLPPAGPPPDRAKWHYRQGVLLAERGREDEARREFDRALALNPAHGPSITRRALDMLQRSEAGAAERALEALAADPDDPLARFAAGTALLRAGELDRAARLLDLAAEALDDAAIHHTAGMARLALRDFPGAAERFRRALRARPQSVDALEGLAIATASSGDDQAAEALLRRTLAADPGRVRALYFLGLLLERSGRPQEAARVLEEAVRVGGVPEARAALERVRAR